MRASIRRSSVLVSLLVLALAPRPRAGDYHEGATLNCSECHVVHVASLEGEGFVPLTWDTDPKSGASSLLKKDINELCLSCHDDTPRATDVLGLNGGNTPHAIRQAGSLGLLGVVGSEATGHTLGSRAIAPGSDPPWSAETENGPGQGLNCINCHAQHGSRGLSTLTYLNLRADPGNLSAEEALVTYNHETPGASDPSRDVFVRRALDYDESAMDFNEPDPTDSAIGRFGSGCHTEFHGRPSDDAIGGQPTEGSWSAFLRHPTAGVDVGALGGEWSSRVALNGHTNRIKLASSSGSWDPAGEDASPTCLSCHKAHGNNNPFGLIYRSGRGDLTEDGDSQGESIMDLCGQCHTQANRIFAP
ncbi:MAG: cytochrome c3 family protein [Planctomycetota bacterium]|jgi:hypothetical protein